MPAVRPDPGELVLPPVTLEEYFTNYETVYAPAMMWAAAMMTEQAVHYGGRERGVLVGACGAIALLGVVNEQGIKEDLVVFRFGANVKERREDRKFCAEWWITGDAEDLIKEHAEDKVEILDISVASPTDVDTIHDILNTDTVDTLCPCHDCIIKLAVHRAVTTSTGIHMRRMDKTGDVERSTTVGDLVQDFSIVPRPRPSDRVIQLARDGHVIRHVRRHGGRKAGGRKDTDSSLALAS